MADIRDPSRREVSPYTDQITVTESVNVIEDGIVFLVEYLTQ